MPSFCDYDNDGDLDCFILTYRLYREGGWPNEPRFEMIGGSPAIKAKYDKYYRILQSGESKGKPEYSVAYAGRHDRLFRNDGNGSFSDVSEEAGILFCRYYQGVWLEVRKALSNGEKEIARQKSTKMLCPCQ